MFINNVSSFSNHLIPRISSSTRGARGHSVPRLCGPKPNLPDPKKYQIPDPPPKVQKEIDKMRKQWKENPPPAPETPEPDNFPQ